MTIDCPECGTPITFGSATSASATCPKCHAVLRPVPMPPEPPAVRTDPFTARWQRTANALEVKFALVIVFLAVFLIAQMNPAIGGGMICLAALVGLVDFSCTMSCVWAPDPAARRSILAYKLTMVGGTVGLFAALMVLASEALGPLPLNEAATVFALGVFAVYFAAFVLLMLFHASVAQAFGNRRLRTQCFVFMAAPLVAAAVNVFCFWLAGSAIFRRGESWNPIAVTQTAFNFGVAICYAFLLLQTVRTIRRGLVSGGGEAAAGEADPDRPIDTAIKR
jgi:hypothetical protein